MFFFLFQFLNCVVFFKQKKKQFIQSSLKPSEVELKEKKIRFKRRVSFRTMPSDSSVAELLGKTGSVLNKVHLYYSLIKH